MPTPRQFGREIFLNVRRGPNISSDYCLRIISKRQCGWSVKDLAAEFKRSESAIKYTIKTYATRAKTQERPRSGRPPIISKRQKKLLWRTVRAQPKIQYKELKKVMQVALSDGTLLPPSSRSTLYRELRNVGLTNWRCKKRPKITHANALARLRWCRDFRNFQWHRSTPKFSDECSIQKGIGHDNE